MAAQQHKPKVVCLARAPQFGKVKTRLAAEAGELRALEIYAELLLENAKLLHACAKEMSVEVSVAGVWELSEFRLLYEESVSRTEQPKGDLGDKMRLLIAHGLDDGHPGVILIGSDCPLLTKEIVQTAADELNRAEVVIGPSEDGGYYLIGMRKEHPELFDDMEWGRNDVLDATLERIGGSNLSYRLLKPLYDIDTAADWERYKG